MFAGVGLLGVRFHLAPDLLQLVGDQRAAGSTLAADPVLLIRIDLEQRRVVEEAAPALLVDQIAVAALAGPALDALLRRFDPILRFSVLFQQILV